MEAVITTAISRARDRQRARPRAHYRTSVWSYRLWWFSLLILHGINIAYYTVVAILYVAVQGTYVDIQLKVYGIGIPHSEYNKVSALHACVAAVHGVFVVLMLGSSAYRRQLVFSVEIRPLYRKLVFKFYSCTSQVGVATITDTSEHRDLASWPSSPRLQQSVITVARTGKTIFSRDGLLGVDSVYFDHVLLVRECLETSLQTLQLYRMTQLLPRLWLIRFYVALLIANCWIVPILHRYYRDREIVRRMLSLLCDAVLDILSSIGITLMLLGVYAPQYTPGYGFALPNWTNDKWMTNLQQEFQMMLVASWLDMFSRLVFAVGLLQCMDAIKDLLAPLPEAKSPANVKAVSSPQMNMIDSVTLATPRSVLSRLVSFLVHVAGPGAFVVWGFVVLAVHIVAETRSSSAPCELRLLPWLSLKPACSLIELNCHHLQSSGDDEAIAEAWSAYNPTRATRLVFRHCPSLVVTSQINAFRQLSGIKIYNSSIKLWSLETPLTEQFHSNMRAVFLVRATLSNGELPPGLLSSSFPRRLNTFSTSMTNLQRLPTSLNTIWPRFMVLTLEFSALTSIPDVFLRMDPTIISVAGSPVAAIQPEVFEIPTLIVLRIAMTRVQELPRNVSSPSLTLRVLNFQNTNVTTLWSWMDDFIFRATLFTIKLIGGHGSVYCRERQEIIDGSRAQFSAVDAMPSTTKFATVMDVSTKAKLAYAELGVNCEPTLPTNFPLNLEDAEHALH